MLLKEIRTIWNYEYHHKMFAVKRNGNKNHGLVVYATILLFIYLGFGCATKLHT